MKLTLITKKTLLIYFINNIIIKENRINSKYFQGQRIYFIMLKESFNEKDITLMNIYVAKNSFNNAKSRTAKRKKFHNYSQRFIERSRKYRGHTFK